MPLTVDPEKLNYSFGFFREILNHEDWPEGMTVVTEDDDAAELLVKHCANQQQIAVGGFFYEEHVCAHAAFFIAIGREDLAREAMKLWEDKDEDDNIDRWAMLRLLIQAQAYIIDRLVQE